MRVFQPINIKGSLQGKDRVIVMRRDVVIVGEAPIDKYVLDIIVLFNSGSESVEIVGKGRNIYKAVNAFNLLREKLEGALQVEQVEIGSERKRRGRTTAYIKIVVKQQIP